MSFIGTSKSLRDDDRSISPIIGTVLMVGIVVILAATVSAAVLGFGEELGGTEVTVGDCNQPVSFDPADMAGFADDVSTNCQGIALWSFDDSYTQGIATDSIGSNDGIVDDSAVYTPGVRKTGLTYDGTDTPVVVSHDESLNFGANDSFAITSWVKIDSSGSKQTIVAKQPTKEKGYSLSVTASGELKTAVGDGTSYTWVDDGPVPTDTWVHVAAVVDRDDQTVTQYINGQTVDADSISPIGSLKSPEDIYLGDSTYKDQKLDGSQDEVRIFNESLSKSEIQDLSQNKR